MGALAALLGPFGALLRLLKCPRQCFSQPGLETRLAGACGSAKLCQRRASSLSSIFAQDGWTPLYSAASSGHEGVVRLLLDSKAAVDTASNVSGMVWVLEWIRYLGLGQTRGRLARCDVISAGGCSTGW